MIHIGLFGVSVHQRRSSNESARKEKPKAPSIPEHLEFTVPEWAYRWTLKRSWINQIDIHVLRCSYHNEAVSEDISAHFDYVRLHNRYNPSTSVYRLSLSVIDGYLMNLHSDLSGTGKLIKIFRSVAVALESSLVFSCCALNRKIMVVNWKDISVQLSVANPYIKPISGLKAQVCQNNEKTTYDASDKIPMLDQIIKAFAIMSSVELRVESFKAEFSDIALEVSSTLLSLKREKSFKLHTIAAASAYVNSLRVFNSETKCVDIPSLTYLFECDLADLFRAYESNNKDNFFVDVSTSLDITHPSLDIYFDQLGPIMAMLKLSHQKSKNTAVQEQKSFMPVPLSKYLRKLRVTSVKLGVSDIRLTLHLPAMGLNEFNRSSVNNVTATMNVAYILTKYSSKELGKILLLRHTPDDPPATLKALVKVKNLLVDIEENLASTTTMTLMVAYCLNTHRVKLKFLTKRLMTKSVNNMIFYVVRRLRESHIKHYNEMCKNIVLTDVSDKVEHEIAEADDKTVEYIDILQLIPEFVTLISLSAKELHGTIVCKDGLPSHKVPSDTLDDTLDLADFRRGVSLVMRDYKSTFDRRNKRFSTDFAEIEVFVLSEYAAKHIHKDFLDNQAGVAVEEDFSDLLSIESFGDEDKEKSSTSKQRSVLVVKDLSIRTIHNRTDKLIVTVPEVDGKIDMFLIWCIFYARSLLKQFQPNVKIEYSKNDVRRLTGHHKKIKLDVNLDSVALKILLPNNVDTLFEIEGMKISDATNWPRFDLKHCRLYVVHPATKAWTRLICIHNTHSSLGELLQDTCYLKSSSILIYVPFRYLFYSVIDNIITMVKASKQIIHNFKKLNEGDHNFERLMPEEKRPILFPSINWCADKFNLSLEDDIFETELSLIYELGQIEQLIRKKKWLKFEEEAKALREQVKTQSTELDANASVDKRRFLSSRRSKKPCHHGHINIANTFRHGFSRGLEKSVPNRSGTTLPESLRTEQSDFGPESLGFNSEDIEAQIEQARERLNEEISMSWIANFNRFKRTKYTRARRMKTKITGNDRISPLMGEKYNIQKLAPGAPIMAVSFHGFDLTLKKAEIDNIDEFLRVYGKGQPKLQYSILIPLFIQLKASCFYISLKDYPLPLLLFPENDKSSQGMDLKGNVVINEKLVFREEEMRHIYVPFTAAAVKERSVDNFYSTNVPRTLTPVKMMFDISCLVDTEKPCILNWSKSYQSAILSAASALDNFSKPPVDDSPIGWWDKMALIMHGKLKFEFPNELCFHMKSSSDPYKIVGKNAGFMWAWKNGVELKFNYTGDQRELVMLDSYDFVFGVPDCSYAKGLPWSSMHPFNDDSHIDSYDGRTFKKQVMKFSSDEKVRWRLGLLFERNEDVTCHDVSADYKRTNEFKPHYDVIITNPEFEWHPDSYEGYRSDYLHLAIGVTSISKKGNSHNTAYLTPVAFQYFFYWWHSISNTVSMPVRQGKLYPTTAMKTSIKMGPHLVTFKYQLILEPLAVSHMYTSYENLDQGPHVIVTGLKGKSTKCHIDLHQRKEVIRYVNEKLGIDKKVHHMKLHLGEVRVCDADIRAIKATFKDPSIRGYVMAHFTSQVNEPFDPEKYHEHVAMRMETIRSSNWIKSIECSELDLAWLDQDDFVELELREELSADPKITVLPFFTTPRFTYFREFTLEKHAHKYPFRNEPSHVCYIGGETPELVQADILKKRAASIMDEIRSNQTVIQNLHDANGSHDHSEIQRLQKECEDYEDRIDVVNEMYQECTDATEDVRLFCGGSKSVDGKSVINGQGDNHADANSIKKRMSNVQSLYSGYSGYKSIAGEVTSENSGFSEFHNRFLFHSLTLKWNNQTRNLVTAYMALIGVRRTETLMMSKKAVDLIESFVKQKRQMEEQTNEEPDEQFKLTFRSSGDVIQEFEEYLNSLTSDNHEMEHKFLVKFIRPQIQLESEVDPNSMVSVTSDDIEMRILSENIAGADDVIGDSNEEEVNAVESRYGVLFKDMQAFVFHRENFSLDAKSPYGDVSRNTWPPSVDCEACIDDSWLEDDLVIEKTSMALMYKKPNFLSLEYAAKLNADELSVHLAKIVVNATSRQYSAIYYIMLNLLLDGKAAKEQLHQRFDQIIEFSTLEDTTGLAEKVKLLQENIKVCQRILLSMEETLNHQSLDDRRGKSHVELEMDKMMVQLTMITLALKSASSQGKGNRGVGKYWNIYADQVIWHLVENSKEPLVDLALAPSKFQRIDMVDGSNTNLIEISMMQAFNLRRKAAYPDFMLPLINDSTYQKNKPVVTMSWKMLSRVGGIRIMRNAKLSCQPASLQLDYDSAQILLEYLFPKDEKGTNKQENENGNLGREYGNSEDLDGSYESNLSKSKQMNNSFRRMFARRNGSPSQDASSADSPKKSFMDDSSSVDNSSTQLSSADLPSFNSTTKWTQGMKRKHQKRAESVDELSVIMNRSSKFFVIDEIELTGMKLRMSFKAPKHLNIIDVHKLMISIPSLHYKQKTWSGEDLILQLKKEIVKIVLSHTGKIIGNKFKHRKRPGNKEPLKQITDFTHYVALDDLQEENTLSEASSEQEVVTRSSILPGQTEELRKSRTPSIAREKAPILKIDSTNS